LAGAVSANLNVRQLLAASERDLAVEKKRKKEMAEEEELKASQLHTYTNQASRELSNNPH
jgi:lipase chaperone LimK